jgi:purine-nucleoside/S-methyl-5'-thioadenosine phosphorylase / adenosine deaminase
VQTTRASAAGLSGLEFHTESSPDPSSIEVLRANIFNKDDDAVCHGFVGRTGGVSREQFASLNLSYFVGDDPAAVDSNWERLRREVPALKTVARINQVHGIDVHVVTRETATNRPPGDGIVTAEPGVILGIFSADCVPILMIDPKQKIAGAFHAGWRGIIADIATVGVNAMTRLGARSFDLCAALGPSIGPCCFEVDQELADRFTAEPQSGARLSPLYVSQVPINPRPLAGEGTASAPGVRASSPQGKGLRVRFQSAAKQNYITPGRPGKAFLDLRVICREQLIRAGLAPTNIANVGPCTRCANLQFFSRRAAAGQTTGLQLSFVGFAG